MQLINIAKKEWKVLLLAVLMVPLFFLNMKDCHDWGGDFSQYIHQAINISKGIPFSKAGYIFNEQYPLAPPFYPPGFSLLLVPVIAIAGNSILAFSYYLTAFLFLLGIAFYYFIRKKLGWVIAFVTVLLIVYNPWTLRFKMEIVSDIPFTFLLLLTVMLYEKISEKKGGLSLYVFTGILSGFLLLIRSIGIIFFAAIIADFLLNIIRNRNSKPNTDLDWKPVLILIASSCFLYLLFMKVIFPSEPVLFSFYSSFISFSDIKVTLLRNSDYYVQNFQRFFHPETGIYNVFPLILKAFALSFLIIGYVFQVLKRVSFLEIFFGLYVGIIILFPNLTQGIRYIFPVIPFALYYIIEGLKSLKPEITIKPVYLLILLGILSLLQYEPGIQKIIAEKDVILQGPQEPESKEAFHIVNELSPADARIAFIKPQVLSLYAERSSIANHFAGDTESLNRKFSEEGVNYFLICNELSNPALQQYINEHQKDVVLIWKNTKFEFYKRIIPE